MALTQAQKAKIKEKLSEALHKNGRDNFECSVCGNKGFTIADGYANLSTSDKIGNVVLGGQNLPNAAIVCDNCGHTYFFNLIVLGVSKDGKE